MYSLSLQYFQEMTFQFPHKSNFHVQILIDHLRRQPQSGDPRYIFGSGTNILLLFPTVHNRLYLHFLSDIKKSDSLGAVDLMSAGREKIDPHTFGVNVVFAESLNGICVKQYGRVVFLDDLSGFSDR